jgi:hypothetical protein
MTAFLLRELSVITLFLDEEQEVPTRKRKWVQRSIQKPKIKGEDTTLFKELVDAETYI